MNTNILLELLENNARLTTQDLADILHEDEALIKSEIQQLEKEKIICGYHTVINYNKALKMKKSWLLSKSTVRHNDIKATTRRR